jgi:hypothetical protein
VPPPRVTRLARAPSPESVVVVHLGVTRRAEASLGRIGYRGARNSSSSNRAAIDLRFARARGLYTTIPGTNRTSMFAFVPFRCSIGIDHALGANRGVCFLSHGRRRGHGAGAALFRPENQLIRGHRQIPNQQLRLEDRLPFQSLDLHR